MNHISQKDHTCQRNAAEMQGDSLTRQNLSQVKISSFQKVADMVAESTS